MSDKLGGARVTFWNFVADGGRGRRRAVLPAARRRAVADFSGFLAMFMLLFIATGIGNGSTFRMIPVIFLHRAAARSRRQGQGGGRQQATMRRRQGSRGRARIPSAIGAYGGFFIPKSYGTSIAMTGGPDAALTCSSSSM